MRGGSCVSSDTRCSVAAPAGGPARGRPRPREPGLADRARSILGLRLTNQPAVSACPARVLNPPDREQPDRRAPAPGRCPPSVCARRIRPAPRTPPTRRGPVSRPFFCWRWWNTRGCETTNRWTVLTRGVSARPPGPGDPLNSTRGSAICMSAMPSWRAGPALLTSRRPGSWVRPRTRRRGRKRRPAWRTCGRLRL